MLKANKGEWSEIYTLLKILGDKCIYAGDENRNKLETYFPIKSISREEGTVKQEFYYSKDEEYINIAIDGELKYTYSVAVFQEKAKMLFDIITKSTGASFEIPEIEEFLKSISCYKIKADSLTKTDINVKIYDSKTGVDQKVGFSIKSMLGKPSSLLNAGKTTNFIYRIKDLHLDDNQIEEINNSGLKERVGKIYELGGSLEYVKMESSTFECNLILIDSLLPQIISRLLIIYYRDRKEKLSLKDITDKLQINNPVNFNLEHGHKFYESKIKHLITDVALGMVPSKVWSGIYEANGGYLIVKKDGNVICYHIYDKNNFENYLFNNTKLETASTTRHDFGVVQKVNDELIIKLNLQIRFVV